MINRRMLIYGAAKDIPATALTIGVGGGAKGLYNGLYYGYSDGTKGGTYGAITPNPLTISGYQGTVKSLYIAGTAKVYLVMGTYIIWEGNNFPTSLMVSLATPAGEPLPDVELYNNDFYENMAVYSFDSDLNLTNQLYEFFRANVGNTVPCEISDAMPQP